MSRYKIALIVLFLFAGLLSIESGYAQLVEPSSSLNPVGSGARATGMGGAFIGVADDATAASWNPAGLIQLEKPEISVVYSSFRRKQRNSTDVPPEFDSKHTMSSDGLNYASAAFPFQLLNRNMIVSLNYQRMYEMNKDISVSLLGEDEGFTILDNIEIRQNGYLYAVSPAMAVQVTPDFSLGATVNFWDNVFGNNGWKMSNEGVTTVSASFDGISLEQRHIDRFNEDISFKGTNAHFGFLWSVSSAVTLGGVYKTPFEAGFDKETSHYFFDHSVMSMPDFPDIETPVLEGTETTTENLTLKMPASYGLGLAYRHSDSLTIGLDVYNTDWSRYLVVDENKDEINPVTNQLKSEGRLKDTTQVRMGAEYLFIKEHYAVPVRLGVFYDPEPQTGHLDEFFGVSAGTGYAGTRVALDAAYQLRTGRNLTGDTPNIEGSDTDVTQHTFMISSIFYF